MIEYIFIAILVILGIVIMGPYVLRSVNAHFKLWDESVQDSSTENLTQAPASDVPKINTNCTCTADQTRILRRLGKWFAMWKYSKKLES